MFAAPQYGFIKLLHLVHMNDIIDINNIINMIIDINNIINMIIDINKVSTQKKIRDYLGIFPKHRTPPPPPPRPFFGKNVAIFFRNS